MAATGRRPGYGAATPADPLQETARPVQRLLDEVAGSSRTRVQLSRGPGGNTTRILAVETDDANLRATLQHLVQAGLLPDRLLLGRSPGATSLPLDKAIPLLGLLAWWQGRRRLAVGARPLLDALAIAVAVSAFSGLSVPIVLALWTLPLLPPVAAKGLAAARRSRAACASSAQPANVRR